MGISLSRESQHAEIELVHATSCNSLAVHMYMDVFISQILNTCIRLVT